MLKKFLAKRYVQKKYWPRFALAVTLLPPVPSCLMEDTFTTVKTDVVSVESAPEAINYDQPSIYFSSVNEIELEVVYEPGAEPFVNGPDSTTVDMSLTESNLAALFQGRTILPALKIPKKLEQMRAISAQSKETWTAQEIYDLSGKERKLASSENKAAFFIAFLKGKYVNEGKVQNGVVGVNLSGFPILAIFKDVVKASAPANPTGQVARFVEQATLIHELGHAFGLVNNGLPLKSSHEETEHPHHCNNDKCVMYWLNEGKNDLTDFIQKYLTSGSTIMFGEECLRDTREYAP